MWGSRTPPTPQVEVSLAQSSPLAKQKTHMIHDPAILFFGIELEARLYIYKETRVIIAITAFFVTEDTGNKP